jgi:hypothetical protein
MNSQEKKKEEEECEKRLGTLFRKQTRSGVCAKDLDNIPKKQTGTYAIVIPKTYGINQKKEIIYIGRSGGGSSGVRERLKKHIDGSDGQPIGAFISSLPPQKRNDLLLFWMENENQRCDEEMFIRCVEKVLRYHPRFNLRSGDSC